MAIEPVGNVPQAPQVIRHEDSLPKKKKDKGKDGREEEPKKKGKIDITV
ncbi:MAG: hypothetical protein M0Z58_06420 [Nitrospiraceae bacterium]|nr:hypothetical protein [Nitrospiraceae bacterium]